MEQAGADAVLAGACGELAKLPTDLSLYADCPNFAYISLGEGQRSAEQVVEEVADKARRCKVRQFAFSEHGVAHRFPNLYRQTLELLAGLRLKAKFYAIGNVYPSDLAAQPDLAALMRRAGYAQICFADDRNVPQEPSAIEQVVEDYRQAAAHCHQVDFPARTEALSGGVCLGRRGDDLEERARFITLVAHHAGSVILWPYQPTPSECPELPLEEQNGKLFPFRKVNGYTYRDYLNVMGLATVLNSKYRTRTFDFLGDRLVSRLFRDSIAQRAWEPDPEVKGALKLPMVVRP
jgi:hypothetical protein